MRTPLLITIAATVALCACADAKDPISDTQAVVARTVSLDLTADRLGNLLGDAKIKVELTPQNSVLTVNMWSNYHRLAYAAAHSDTLDSHLTVAVAPTLNSERVGKYLQELRRSMKHDTATQAAYDSASHGLFAVRHILFAFPDKATPSQRDSVREVARRTLMKVTARNFVEMARTYSADKQTAAKGGYLGVFPRQAMNPSVISVVASLAPDSVSRLVGTQFGFDIIQRLSWADARAQFVPAYSQVQMLSNDSLTSERIAKEVGLELTDRGIAASRDVALNPAMGRRDSTVIATYNKGGQFTVAELLSWVNIMPPAQRAQVLNGMPLVPDSMVASFVRNLAMRSVLLRAADSAKIDVSPTLKAELRTEFRKGVLQAWRELGVAPDQLADSARTVAEREQLAAKRIDRIIERGLSGSLQLTPLPLPIEAALDAKYAVMESTPALRRALEIAQEKKRVADSVTAALPDAPVDSPATKKPAAPAARKPAKK